ncbi:nucleotidyl transferase AbiEii/AbiGii toxin family protein [Iningainema tapete]|uniref:Nucleotidyl transferase AbiEii/AbiGii toxin family protein n=1 Tax=Iningainema tapete BLCC-T55 TaxID=2748662 RepID=A0A8J6XW70_9CYAN|nr:nucleotidyl transferase AbiEii/AbiGii toxin family protein [Iningainema tapete]MBD2777457.1 nucleotidyl transferase AbiEii/AbiGii toxin family protein [Iningainema tapete BLCC-T55]
MSQQQPRNIPASVRRRLLHLSKEQGEDFNYLLTRYAADRLLYRLSQSVHKHQFILKGATLFRVWSGEPHRATKDVDLLGHGNSEISSLTKIFQEICEISCEDDGITFGSETVKGEKIKEDQEYEGVRIKLRSQLETTTIQVQIDIGFGDAVTPKAQEVEFPPILNLPAPCLLIYPRETVIAEKFQAMVALGIMNSRLKDFYDIWFLCQKFEFQGTILSEALKNTFHRRRTPLPIALPFALTAEFAFDKDKQKQWKSFVDKGQLKTAHVSLPEVIAVVGEFLMPPSLAAAQGEVFNKIWIASTYWSEMRPFGALDISPEKQ